MSNLKSAPRWVWSFKREIAKYIFPIPPTLFAEDIWFCLIIKKYSSDIIHINNDLYIYKQHKLSEWGGITNFNKDVMIQRAKWNINLIPVLLDNRDILNIKSNSVFSNISNYYKVFLTEIKLVNILNANTTIFYQIKLIIIIYYPSIASYLLATKWFLTKNIIIWQIYLQKLKL